VARGLLTAFVCALFCASTAAAGGVVKRPDLTWVRGDGSYTKASRTPARHTITTIVIHATDGGTLGGNVWWLSAGHSHASAHYVISRDGSIVQLVHLSDIAWHAGNWKVNQHSIGIEHVGDTYDPAGFSNAEYTSSAKLAAWLVRRYDIPVDRAHIIGHSQVPDPNDPALLGGSDHHTDPGPHWKWAYYLNLVRRFAYPERYAIHVRATIDPAEALDGIVPWGVRTTGPTKVRRVDFLVDGRLVWSDSRKPFSFAGGRGWNTTQVANGAHALVVRASGGGRTATQRLVVHVQNHDFALTTSALHPWQKVKGVLRVRANVRGAKTHGIGLYVDGKIWSRDLRAPYALRWNTHRVHDGKHVLTLAAVASDGRVAKRRLPLVVSNKVAPKKKPKPRPKPGPAPPTTQLPPAPQVTAQNLADGQTVDGVVDWRAHTIGAVARVDFVVDGVVLATQTAEPWATTWDATNVAVGTHQLEVRAYTKDGRQAVLAITVSR
jgi:N-acetyl-anhydromuramyl-L-alanine amidase AmpD